MAEPFPFPFPSCSYLSQLAPLPRPVPRLSQLCFRERDALFWLAKNFRTGRSYIRASLSSNTRPEREREAVEDEKKEEERERKREESKRRGKRPGEK